MVIKTSANNINAIFSFANKVEDDIRGYVVYVNNSWEFVGVSEYNCKYNCIDTKKIALVLESPHIDEYTTNYVPIRPANGRTGRKIEKKLPSKLANNANLLANCAYEIFIINPVQYQCSCAHFLPNFKTNRADTHKVFRKLFNSNYGKLRQDFINRLGNYNPDIVINACTCSLKAIVDTAIHDVNKMNTVNKAVQFIPLPHPSIW